MTNKFTVVFHPCYRADQDRGLYIYSSSDEYLQQYPSMYTWVGEFDSLEEAEAFIKRELEIMAKQDTFVVAFHHLCRDDQDNGLRIHLSSDSYLQRYPSMYTWVAEFLSLEEAEEFIKRELESE